MWLSSRYLASCVKTAFSITLESIGSSGSLTIDFNKGITLAYFQMSGNVAVLMDKLMMCARAGAIKSAASFIVLVSM